MNGYEAWRPALVAFYRGIGSKGCAQLVELGALLTQLDIDTIEGLRAVNELLSQKQAA